MLDKNKGNEIAESIISAINIIVDSKLSKSGFDKTYTAKIIHITPQNKYTVLIQNKKYSNIPSRDNAMYSVGDIVDCTARLGQMSQLKIVGRS